MSQRYGSNLSFNDVLFNALLGFVVLFVLALLLINPITKKADIPSKAEIMFILEWDAESSDDLDTWILGPMMGSPVSFQNKTSGYMHLDRDDLGRQSDTMVVNGVRTVIKINREVVTMRGILAGDYYINIHVYNKRGADGPTKYTVTLLDVNPYKEIYVMQGEVTKRGEIIKLPGFTVNEEGEVTDTWTSDKQLPGVQTRRDTSSGNGSEEDAANNDVGTSVETSIDALGN